MVGECGFLMSSENKKNTINGENVKCTFQYGVHADYRKDVYLYLR